MLLAWVKGLRLALRGLEGRRCWGLNWRLGLNRSWWLNGRRLRHRLRGLRGRMAGRGGRLMHRRHWRCRLGGSLRGIRSLRSNWLLCSRCDRRVCGHLGKGRTSAPENRGLSVIWLAGPTRSLNHRRYLTLLGAWRALAPGMTVRNAVYTLRIR